MSEPATVELYREEVTSKYLENWMEMCDGCCDLHYEFIQTDEPDPERVVKSVCENCNGLDVRLRLVKVTDLEQLTTHGAGG